MFYLSAFLFGLPSISNEKLTVCKQDVYFVYLCNIYESFGMDYQSGKTILTNLLAGVFFAFLGLQFSSILRKKISAFFGVQNLRVSVPLMSSVAPIIHGIQKGIWEDHDLSVRLKWNYSGQNSLLELEDEFNSQSNEINIAIATDYAIAKYLSNNQVDANRQLVILPFVAIENHMSLVIFDNEKYGKYKKILYYPDSAQEEYLIRVLNRSPEECVKAKNLIDLICKVSGLEPDNEGKRDCGAGILWEPYNKKYEDLFQAQDVVTPQAEVFKWVLCVVVAKSSLSGTNGKKIANSIYDVIVKTCNESVIEGNREELATIMAQSIPEQLSGITKIHLSDILKGKQVKFGTDNATELFEEKIKLYSSEKEKFANIQLGVGQLMQLEHTLWKNHLQ